jgi:hypothetical protein
MNSVLGHHRAAAKQTNNPPLPSRSRRTSHIGISRLAANDHHLSDVVAGAALGFSVGRTVVRRNGRPPNPPKPPPNTNVAVWLDGGPASDGVGLRFAIDFR